MIDDDQLLFSGTYKRDGGDLLISHDDRKIVIPDYFKGEARATLTSRDGATLTPDVIKALTGYTDYAQATAPEPPKEIGTVQKLTGTATAIRNGVSVQLNVGDKVHKGDVLESAGSSSLGVVFVDGTVFNLSSNARMVLNEMVYDPNGSSNSSLLSLVQGTITFVAGQTAKNGNMRVDTPVATMGIRGTTVLVKINSADGRVQLSVERDPDGKVGSFVIYDKTTGQLIGTVTREGDKTIITPSPTPGQQATIDAVPKTYAEKVADLQFVKNVFEAFFPEIKKDPNNANPQRQGNNGAGTIDPRLAELGKGAERGETTVPIVASTTGTGAPTTSGSGTATVVSPPVNVNPFADFQAPNAIASSFLIGDQVQPDPLIIPYIPNSAQLTQSTTTSPIPSGFNLAALITIDGPSGRVSYNSNDFRFLGIGETATYEITFQAQTGPFIVTKTLVFTEKGLNDAPIYTDLGKFFALVDEPLGTGSLDLFMKQGELKFTDADFSDVASGYTVQTTGVSTLGEVRAIPNNATLLSFLTLDGVTKAVGTTEGSIKQTFAAPAKTFDYLAQGETVNIVYTVKVTDAQGATNTATLTVIITGTNDVPTITGATTVTSGAVFEDGGPALEATGTITFQDVDLSDSHVASAVLTSSSLSSPLPGFDPATSLLVKFEVEVDPNENTTDGINTSFATWTYTLDNALAQVLAKGQTITQVYTVTIDDGKGGTVTQDVTVTVTGANDVPTIEVSAIPVGVQTAVATVDSGVVTEDAGVSGGDLSAVGTIVFKDVDLIDTHTATVVLKSSNASVDLPGFDEGDGPDAESIGTFTLGLLANLNGDINDIGLLGWTFTLNNADPTLQSLAVGQTITQVYTITITDNNGASVTRDVTIVINGANDDPDNNAPVIVVGETDALGAVIEGNSANTLTDSGTITFQDIDLIDAHTIPGPPLAPSSVTVTKGGVAQPLPGFSTFVGTLTLTLNENTTDTNNKGTVGWVFSVADNDPNVQALAEGQVITQNYTVTIDDAHGGRATQIITVTITGTNDAPTIVGASTTPAGGVTEDEPSLSVATGTVAFTDVDLIDGHTASFAASPLNTTVLGTFALTAVSEAAGAASGTVGWSYTIDPAAVQYLAFGETRTEVYTVTINDLNGGTITQDVTITITGTNDAPTIVGASTTPSGGVTEDEPSLSVATGTVAFTDVDLIDGHTASFAASPLNTTVLGTFALTAVSEAAGAAAGTVGWSYTIDPAAVQYLAFGETRTEVYTVTIDDLNGGTITQDVTITITGTNDAPSIVGASTTPDGGVTEDEPSLSVATGTVAFTDVDLIDGHSASFAASPLNTTVLGTFALTAVSEAAGAASGTVGWSYTIDPAAVQYLAFGETRTEVYTVTIDDLNGGTITQDVTITITGTNDAPSIGAIAAQTLPEQADGEPLETTIAVTFTDVDLTDVGHGAEIVGVSRTGTTTGLSLSDAQLKALLTIGAVTKTSGSAAGSFDIDFSAASTVFDYLGVGDSLTLTYTLQVDDGDGGVVSKTFDVTITGTNDAPVIDWETEDLDGTVEEQLTPGVGDLTDTGVIKFSDVDLTDAHTVSATPVGTTLGSLRADLIADTTGTGAGGELNWTYTIDPALIESLSKGEIRTESFTVTLSDGESGGTITRTVTIEIVGTNDAPVITANAELPDAPEDSNGSAQKLSVLFAGKVTDADAADRLEGFVITGAGDGTAGVWQFSDDGENWSEIGPVSLEAGLLVRADAFIKFVPAPDFNGDAPPLTVYAVDKTYTGTGGFTSSGGPRQTVSLADDASRGEKTPFSQDSAQVTATITPVNDAPVIAAVAPVAIDEPSDSPTFGTQFPITFTDVDVLDNDHTATITNVETSGEDSGLTLSDATLIDLAQPMRNGDRDINLMFSAGATEAAAFDYLATGDVLTLTYTLEIDDLDGGVATSDFVINITGTNDAPFFTSGETAILAPVTEDDIDDNPGQTVASFASANISDVDRGALQGIAITFANENDGLWQFSTDAGATWSVFPSYSATEALLLAATDKVRFIPNVQDAGSSLIRYVAWDQTTGTHGTVADVSVRGDGTAFSMQTVEASIAVTAVNDAPVITSDGGGETATVSVEENNTTVTTVMATDIDSPAITYEIVGGADAALFDIDETTGVLRFVTAPDFENPVGNDNFYEVAVEAFDGTDTDTQTITVNVTDASDAPPPENQPPLIATSGATATYEPNPLEPESIVFSGLSVSDPDAGDEMFTVDLVTESGTLTGGLDSPNLTFAPDDGDEGTLSASGTLAAINAALQDGITYAPGEPNTGKLTVTVFDQAGASDLTNFIFAQHQEVTLQGTPDKKDVFIGSGGADNFVFAASTGRDVITNFQQGSDTIDLTAYPAEVNTGNIDQWIEDHASAVPDSNDTLIDFDGTGVGNTDNTILLKNISLANLSTSDFIVSGP